MINETPKGETCEALDGLVAEAEEIIEGARSDAVRDAGMLAAAQAVDDAGKSGEINVTGLGLPSEMAGAIASGASKSFSIWNPIDLGYSATMIAHALATGAAHDGPALAFTLGAGVFDFGNISKPLVAVDGRDL